MPKGNINIKVVGLARYSSGLREMKEKLEDVLSNNIKALQLEIQEFTEKLLKDSPSFFMLTKTTLRGDFGFPEGTAVPSVSSIIESFVEDINIDFIKIFKYSSFQARFNLVFNRDNFSKLINLPEASMISENGEEVDWLRWLLTSGDKVILAGYNIYFAPDRGRSEIAVMVESDGGAWKVPSSISGTLRNNFITREINKHSQEYEAMIASYVQTQFNNAKK